MADGNVYIQSAAINRGKQTVTIASGAALSNGVDLSIHTLVAIAMPVAWTAAGLTFQVKGDDDDEFQDLYDELGEEVTIPAAAGHFITLAGLIIYFAGAEHVKVRSGTAAAPVNQGAARSIKLITKPLSA